MDSGKFSEALGKALALCRSAAELGLPIEAMLEHVGDGIEAATASGFAGAQTAGESPDAVVELEALREILSAVGEVAAIGEKLPAAEPEPAALDCPLPANLRSEPRANIFRNKPRPFLQEPGQPSTGERFTDTQPGHPFSENP